MSKSSTSLLLDEQAVVLDDLPIEDWPIHVPIELSAQIGMNEAIFLYRLNALMSDRRWSQTFDGRRWVRCSIDEWTKQFPFWSTQTVRRIIATLERSDLLLTSIQYNEYSFDRTRWFSADYDAIIAQPVRVNRTPPYVKIPIPLELRAAILERDGFRCLHCGVQDRLSIDHIIPESRGGTMDIENLQTLCRRCNSRKGNR